MALYHREPVIPARLILGENAFPPLSNAFSEIEVLKIWKTARMEILKSQVQQKKQFDKKARTTRFEVGDYVMYKKHVRNKLQPRYHPPSKIVQKGPTLNSWRIRTDDGSERTAPGEHLKIYKKGNTAEQCHVDSTSRIVPDALPPTSNLESQEDDVPTIRVPLPII